VQFQLFSREYVRGLADGDSEVARHFAEYFCETLRIKLRRALRCEQAIQDVRQETLLRVLRALRQRGGLDEPEKLGAFVNGVCNNVLAEHFRAVARASARPVHEVEPVSTAPGPESGCANEERKRHVAQILAGLPRKEGEILRLMFLEERERDEICRMYRVNRGYLRVLVHRAKRRFRESVRADC
jgi:RNA polymerase sigma-70 factor, ECF subfamily